MQEIDKQAFATIIAAVVLLIVIGMIMLFLAVYYTNRKKKLMREKEQLKVVYEQAILQSQLEIQEQTLRNVSKEIHDNIGQVLSYVSLSLDRAADLNEDQRKGIIAESKLLVNQSMNDLRDLSKSFSLDNIASKGLSATIEAEVIRLNKSRLIRANLNIEGQPTSFGENRELILFRILQEFINNTLKHARAKNLNIDLKYQADKLLFKVEDDGIGFNLDDPQNNNGSGIRNIRTRAGIIGADAAVQSRIGEGSSITLSLTLA
ncbi:sensor histidine kinase [Mucilaginibacter paludis]|uniref:histidine kinase n=1 Tax=Mucilaginibacter paludis DSM 18603 TaxID=714943 RepID=H1YFJ3_9SPHI|nr:ATP-binding protein [Mucilaginibacter paludis]EHQ27301.1 putative signal transduction histidine kinase [Mucilaginibacter paludis DSM 18603]